MKKIHSLGLMAISFMLDGQGCLGGATTNVADGGIWRTDNAGGAWTQMSSLPTATGISSIAGVNVTSIEIDPSDDSALYIGTEQNGVLYSIDNGNTWQRPESPLAREGSVLDVEVDRTSVCTVYLLKTDSVEKSIDCQRTYKTIYTEGRADKTLTTMVLDWFNPSTLWMGTTAGEVLKSQDGGATWSTVYRAEDDVTSILLSNKDSRVVMIGTNRKGMFRSEDAGATWKSYEKELKNSYESSDEVYSFAQSATGDVMIMNSRFGLLASHDQGLTWTALPIIPPPADQRILSVVVSPGNASVIYYGTLGTLYTSVNGGETWSTVTMPSARLPKAMRVHPSITDRLFVGFAAIPKSSLF